MRCGVALVEQKYYFTNRWKEEGKNPFPDLVSCHADKVFLAQDFLCDICLLRGKCQEGSLGNRSFNKPRLRSSLLDLGLTSHFLHMSLKESDDSLSWGYSLEVEHFSVLEAPGLITLIHCQSGLQKTL